MPVYHVIRQAIRDRRRIRFFRERDETFACPLMLGHDEDGTSKVFLYTFDGRGLPAIGSRGSRCGFRCMFLADLSNAEIIDGPWTPPDGWYAGRPTCMKKVTDMAH